MLQLLCTSPKLACASRGRDEVARVNVHVPMRVSRDRRISSLNQLIVARGRYECVTFPLHISLA